MFIVFEGIDGCGKDTQIDILKQYLERSNHKVKIYSNIDNGMLASEIRDYLSNGGISSYMLSYLVLTNIQDTYRNIKKDLDDGYIILCSRWTMSSIAYGGYKDEYKLNNVFNFAKTLDVKPDVILYIDIKPDIALSRINARGGVTERYDNIEKLIKISEAYTMLFDLNVDNELSKYVNIINGNETIHNIHKNIKQYISNIGNIC